MKVRALSGVALVLLVCMGSGVPSAMVLKPLKNFVTQRTSKKRFTHATQFVNQHDPVRDYDGTNYAAPMETILKVAKAHKGTIPDDSQLAQTIQTVLTKAPRFMYVDGKRLYDSYDVRFGQFFEGLLELGTLGPDTRAKLDRFVDDHARDAQKPVDELLNLFKDQPIEKWPNAWIQLAGVLAPRLLLEYEWIARARPHIYSKRLAKLRKLDADVAPLYKVILEEGDRHRSDRRSAKDLP